MKTTTKQRADWANPAQHVSNRPTVEAAKWKEAARDLIADVELLQKLHTEIVEALETVKDQRLEAHQQLIYWWETQRSCPCGARAEALGTHPHVLLCPTERALIYKELSDA